MSARVGGRRATVGGRTRSARCIAAVAACVIPVAACSGDDDTADASTAPTVTVPTAPAPTTPPPSTSAPPTTVTSTTAAPTTSPAPTSPPPTTPAPTTVAPTTVAPVATTAALADEEQALAVVDGFYSAWRDCLRELPTCDTSSFGAYLVDPHLENAQSSVATWQSSSYAVIDVDALAYEVAEVNLGHAIPHVVVCEVDGSSLVERRPGEPDSVVQGGYVEAIREVHLLSTSRGWRIEGFSTRDEVWDQEGALC